VIDRAAEQSSNSLIMRKRLPRFCLANQFVHNLYGRGILFLFPRRDWLLDMAVMSDASPGSVPFSRVLSPLVQGDEIPAAASVLFFNQSKKSASAIVLWCYWSFCAGLRVALLSRMLTNRSEPDWLGYAEHRARRVSIRGRLPQRRIHRGNFAIISGNRQPAQLVISAMQKSSKIWSNPCC
jgi:hypothetical protein